LPHASKLNHTILHAHDQRAAADFYAEVLRFGTPVTFGAYLDAARPTTR
jgi:hypothetical protein